MQKGGWLGIHCPKLHKALLLNEWGEIWKNNFYIKILNSQNKPKIFASSVEVLTGKGHREISVVMKIFPLFEGQIPLFYKFVRVFDMYKWDISISFHMHFIQQKCFYRLEILFLYIK